MYIIQDVNALFPVLSDFRAKNEKSAQNVPQLIQRIFQLDLKKKHSFFYASTAPAVYSVLIHIGISLFLCRMNIILSRNQSNHCLDVEYITFQNENEM